MNDNLAHELPEPKGEMVQFPKKERQVMSKKDEGYTPLPNFICDEGYLAVLDGDAIKCLMLLNRHIKGFHLENKDMSEALVKKITGIKDGRTVQKYMAQLAKYKLIKIDKERGKSNVYSLTFDSRLPTQDVGAFNVPTHNAPTCNVGGVPTQDVGGSTYTACRSVKEIDLKENIKTNTQERTGENSVDSVLNLWTPDLHSLNSWLQRSGEKPMTLEQVNENLLEVNAHYEPRLNMGLVSDTQMYANFVKWVKRKFTPKNKTGNFQQQPQKPSRWDEIQQLIEKEEQGNDGYGF